MNNDGNSVLGFCLNFMDSGIFQVALAIYMSANAYTSWEEDPIITTVKVNCIGNW